MSVSIVGKNIIDKLLFFLDKSAVPCSLEDPDFCKKISHLIGDARIVLVNPPFITLSKSRIF